MSDGSSLYGIPRQKSSAKDISSPASLAFTSQLSSLLTSDSQTSTPRTSKGRTRPTGKTDIFTSHNRNAKKRAAKDLEPSDSFLKRSKHSSLPEVDDAVLHRSRKKMEEKARLYAAMKRGDYVAPGGEDARDERNLVDFDRKWAESEARGEASENETSSEDAADSEEETVDYIDEFGRQRQGTRSQVLREEMKRKAQAADEPDRFTARPSQPTNLIYGDTIQAAAFNPDEPIVAKMETLASKRDRSATPPPEVHYDANSEIRSKGVGFYSFSKDKEARKQEMDALERERLETERVRNEQQARKDKRKADIEARRQKIREKKGEKQAEKFLTDLMGELDGGPSESRTNT